MFEVGKCLLSDRLQQSRMTQQDLALKLGVTKQQISSYTRTKKPKIMSLEVAKNIAVILHCEIEDLYEWIPVEARKKRR